jgi:hypothetical protein
MGVLNQIRREFVLGCPDSGSRRLFSQEQDTHTSHFSIQDTHEPHLQLWDAHSGVPFRPFPGCRARSGYVPCPDEVLGCPGSGISREFVFGCPASGFPDSDQGRCVWVSCSAPVLGPADLKQGEKGEIAFRVRRIRSTRTRSRLKAGAPGTDVRSPMSAVRCPLIPDKS